MHDRQLLVFSIAFIIWAILAIIVPYVRGKADLLTAHNFFMLGAIIFVGLSGMNASWSRHFKEGYSSQVYLYYYAGIVVFFTTFRLAYRHLKWPRKMAATHFRTWPRLEGMGLWAPMGLAMIAAAGQVALLQIPGLRSLVVVTGLVAPIFALTFALAIWRSDKMNPIAIAAVLSVFAMGAILAFTSGGGRRPLYGLVMAIPCCAYWWNLRYRKPIVVIGIFAATLLLVPLADAAYRAARWQGLIGTKRLAREEGAQVRWSIFKNSLFSGENSLAESTVKIGQNTAECSLVTIYIFKQALAQYPTFHVKPLHSLYVIGTLPIPREVWPEKPVPLGITLPYDSKILNTSFARTNWGPGIVAHGVHDGGMLVLVLYGILAGVALRFIDELLVLNPGNPYLLAFFGAASVQIAGWIRGDIATMTAYGILCFVVMIVLLIVARFVAGVHDSWRPSPFGAPARLYQR